MTDLIVRKPNIQGGVPCIAGTRVTVAAVQSWAASGFDNERIKQEYPGLTDEQIDAARAYKVTPVTDIDLDKLEALAKGATPGEWASDHDGCITKADNGWSFIPLASAFTEGAFYKDEKAHANAAFIAAANPATIKSLIASAREAAAEIERLRRIEAIAKMLDRHLGEDDRMWSDDSTISTEWIGSDGVRRSLTFGLFRQLREALSARAAQMDGEG